MKKIIMQHNLRFNVFPVETSILIVSTQEGRIPIILTFPFPILILPSPTNTMQRQQRCRGTTLALSCPRSPTAGRARPTLTSSMAPSSPTSATLDLSWLARRSSCASGISHGVVTCQDVKKVRGSSQRQVFCPFFPQGKASESDLKNHILSASFALGFIVSRLDRERKLVPF